MRFKCRRFEDPGPIPLKQRAAVDWLVDQLCEFDANDVRFVEAAAVPVAERPVPPGGRLFPLSAYTDLPIDRRGAEKALDRVWPRLGGRYGELSWAMEKITLTLGDESRVSSYAGYAVFATAMRDVISDRDYEALIGPWRLVWHDWLQWATDDSEVTL